MNTKLLIEKARTGDFKAQEQLAWCYDKGIAVRKSYRKAFKLYKKLAAHGNPVILYNLGLCYLLGQGTDRDSEKAFYWAKKAADSGDADAALALAWHFHNGLGVKQNYAKAVEWYQKSLKKKESGAGYFSLGQIAYDTEQFEVAAKYFLEAKDKFEHPRSSYYLGRMFFEGTGFEKDFKKAEILLEEASNSGVYKARRLLNSRKFKTALLSRK